jgi:hypothetical protein
MSRSPLVSQRASAMTTGSPEEHDSMGYCAEERPASGRCGGARSCLTRDLAMWVRWSDSRDEAWSRGTLRSCTTTSTLSAGSPENGEGWVITVGLLGARSAGTLRPGFCRRCVLNRLEIMQDIAAPSSISL